MDPRTARPLHGQAINRREGARRVTRGPQGSELGRSEAEIAEQTTMLRDLRADVERAAEAVNRMESVRGQLQALARTVKDTEILKLAAEVERKFTELEMNLVELRATGRGQDGVRFGAKLTEAELPGEWPCQQ